MCTIVILIGLLKSPSLLSRLEDLNILFIINLEAMFFSDIYLFQSFLPRFLILKTFCHIVTTVKFDVYISMTVGQLQKAKNQTRAVAFSVGTNYTFSSAGDNL